MRGDLVVANVILPADAEDHVVPNAASASWFSAIDT